MVFGWRKAFCTSISKKEREPPVIKDHQEQTIGSFSTKLAGFFSSPSTPRFQAQPVSGGRALLCQTISSTTTIPHTTTATSPVASVPESPNLELRNTRNSPRFFHRSSNPSSPRSPSAFSLLKISLGLSKSRCGICLQNAKTGQGMAIFTAECSHTFHFNCISSQAKKQSQLVCPVCSSTWKELPILSIPNYKSSSADENKMDTSPRFDAKSERKQPVRSVLKVYNDDEPLRSPTSVTRFNPIPESDENGGEESESVVEEFQGFYASATTSPCPIETKSENVDVRLLPEAAVVSIGRSYVTCVIVLKVRAPPAPEKMVRRAPIDLVTVLDVSRNMTTEKMQMMKHAMRLVVSSLSSADRLSIVAFSATSKRLLPLRRMTANGRRSARRIVDALSILEGTSSANDAVKKGAKVLEDRREKNPAGSIIVIADNHQRPRSSFVFSTGHLDIPVHSTGFNQGEAYGHVPPADAFAKCVGGFLGIVVQDVRLQLGFVSGSASAEIAAVYSCNDRPESFRSNLVRIGDLYSEEERELLVEMKVPSSSIGAHHAMSLRCCYRDPLSKEVFYGGERALVVPRPQTVRSSSPTIQRLRSLFLATRALAESRTLVERHDLTGAYHILSSARALLLQQASSASAEEFISGLEVELAKINHKRQNQNQQNQLSGRTVREIAFVDEKGEPLTPTSAWRAAEKLVKVAMMKKSLNRVGDLYGFEDARF